MLNRRTISTAVLVPVLAGAALVAAPAAGSSAATPPIRITKIYYDSPGSDRGGSTSLNAEYVRITNTTSKARSISGWTLRDRQGFTYRFPTFTLKAKASVYVHTGKGRSTSTHRYWGRSWYVWNNTGDTAYLRDSKGTLKDSWKYSSNRYGYVSR